MAKVLIVDDSRVYRYTLSKMVKEWGHQVNIAKNGEQAIKMVHESKPDLILMDIVMPGMSGYQAKRILAKDERTADIPVIFCSTRDDETDRIWGLRQGATAYVTKPVKPDDLMKAITNVVAA